MNVKNHYIKKNFNVILMHAFLILIVVILAGCSTSTPAPTETAVPTETLAPSDTPAPTLTSTPVPTETFVPTDTPTPTETAIPTLAVIESGFHVLCLPHTYYNPDMTTVLPDLLAEGRPEEVNASDPSLMDVMAPATYCGFFVTFNQILPAGAKVEFLQGTDPNPWLTLELTPMADDPNTGYAITNHTMVINPPAWELMISAEVVSADGYVQMQIPIHIYKRLPPLCWNGTLPNPVTLECPSIDQ
jgi:hypothetical protein